MAARFLQATLLAAMTPVIAAAETQAPSITVQGSCSVRILPDRASVDASAERRGPDASRAIAEATAAYNKFRADVEKLNLPDVQLDSSGVQVGRLPEDDAAPARTPVFVASAGLSIETSKLAGLADVTRLAALDRIDAVSPLQSFVSDALRDRLVAECLPKAAADAKAKAAALLQGVDATLGAVQSVNGIDTGGGGMQPMRMALAAAPMRKAMVQPTAELSAGPQTITVTTTVTFLIVQAAAAGARATPGRPQQ